jgi:hypothetical protein
MRPGKGDQVSVEPAYVHSSSVRFFDFGKFRIRRRADYFAVEPYYGWNRGHVTINWRTQNNADLTD